MTFARTFSLTSLIMLGLLIYGGIASAQTTSYVAPGASGNGTNGASVQNTGRTNGTVNGSTTSGSVLGASSSNPNLPNTGAGGDAAGTAAALLASGLAALGGTALLLRRRA